MHFVHPSIAVRPRVMTRLLVVLLVVACALIGACGEIHPIGDLPCPCATGYVCCDQVCKAEGSCAVGNDCDREGSLVVSCGDSVIPPGGSDASVDAGFVDPEDCENDCSDPAIFGCNVDQDTADAECMTLCASSPNAKQLACLAASPCTKLVSALANGTSICGITGTTVVQPDGGSDDTTDAGTGGSVYCSYTSNIEAGAYACTYDDANFFGCGCAGTIGASAAVLAQAQLTCMSNGGAIVPTCPSANLVGCCTTPGDPGEDGTGFDVACSYGAPMQDELSCTAASGTWSSAAPQ
jgi:hypothetical protein